MKFTRSKIHVPVLIAGVRATAVAAGGSGAAATWLGVLAAFDAAVLAVGLLVYGQLLED